MKFLPGYAVAALVLTGLSPISAQAAIGPVEVGQIISACESSTDSEAIDLGCTMAVDDFLRRLASTLPQEASSDIGTVVAGLGSVPLSSSALCARLTREIGRLGEASSDSAQAGAIGEIAATVGECASVATAAIAAPFASPLPASDL